MLTPILNSQHFANPGFVVFLTVNSFDAKASVGLLDFSSTHLVSESQRKSFVSSHYPQRFTAHVSKCEPRTQHSCILQRISWQTSVVCSSPLNWIANFNLHTIRMTATAISETLALAFRPCVVCLRIRLRCKVIHHIATSLFFGYSKFLMDTKITNRFPCQ